MREDLIERADVFDFTLGVAQFCKVIDDRTRLQLQGRILRANSQGTTGFDELTAASELTKTAP